MSVNGKGDPLRNNAPFSGKELFNRFSKAADGFPTDAAVVAAGNILLNALRQTNATRAEAEKAFNELFGRLKQTLLDHYDSTGKRRPIFPFHQTIEVPLMRFRKPQ